MLKKKYFEEGLIKAQNGDFSSAREIWFELAIDGHVEAQFMLGAFFQGSYGVPFNRNAAVTWYSLAAGQGHVKAQLQVALLLSQVAESSQDYELPFLWFKRAAEACDPEAQFYVAWLFQEGKGTEKNLKSAIYWFEKAAQAGNYRAKQALFAIPTIV